MALLRLRSFGDYSTNKMKEGIWIDGDSGEQELLLYDDIDPEVLPRLLQKPVGGFCYPVYNFLRLPLAKVPFYLKDWLPKPGKAIFYAPAKTGKSFFTYQMARCIGSGLPFLEIPTTQGRVLVLQFELGASILQQRLKDTKQDYENVYVGTTFSMKLDTLVGQEVMLKAVKAVNPDVVILDPLAKILMGDENESHDVRLILDFLDSIISAYDCSIVIMHHSGKDIAKGGRGTSVLMDYPDAYIEVKRISKKGQPLQIRIDPKRLRHAELSPEPIEAELVGFEFERIGKEPSVLFKVRSHLAEFKVVEAKELLQFGSRRSMYGALKKLVEIGVVVQLKRGAYQWVGGEQKEEGELL